MINHKQLVGPPHLYDIIGLHQLEVLVQLGLREYHKVLDIGCGLFRAGRFIIEYLDDLHYFGVEPNAYLLEYGLSSVLQTKKCLSHSSNKEFDFTEFGETFDYVLCHALLTHFHRDEILRCLNGIREVLHKKSLALVTFAVSREKEYKGKKLWVDTKAFYTETTLQDLARQANLSLIILGVPHPCGQRWGMLRL